MREQDLHKLAELMSADRGLSIGTIGLYAAKDGKFFGRIAGGGGCTLRTANRVVRWFSENWPEDQAWPSDIPRPPHPRRKSSKKEAA